MASGPVFWLDLLWLLPWYRKKRIEQARTGLSSAQSNLARIEDSLRPFSSNVYVPERVRRPLLTDIDLVDKTLPPIAKIIRRTRDEEMRDQLGSVTGNAARLRTFLTTHNDQYVHGMITEHSKLLVDELSLDSAQRVATVRDDERNLVIAAAGSGKTRTLIARIRYLLERGVPAETILAVTFTNKATEEMEDRLKQMRVDVADREHTGVTVSTLHALGKRIVQATLQEPISVADDNWADTLVASALHKARTAQDPQLASLYLNTIVNFHRNLDEAATEERRDLTYRTLRGEHVRSIGERIIANFLFTHQVGYRYEAKADWADVGKDRDAYHPDFLLPDTGASIEYWGINRAGKVPESWGKSASADYNQEMKWKRDLYNRQRRKLIEFFDFERTEGTLEQALQTRLVTAGVVLRPMCLDQLEKAMGDTRYIGDAIERLLVQFIANARSLRLTGSDILTRSKGATPRVYHFGRLGIAVLELYEANLASEEMVDFPDMLHRASDTLEKGVNPLPKFQQILVDEFQDTSAAMARFLKALLAVNGASLLAVGDDWQAIYGFAGGDVDHMLKFESHFGPASASMLDVNYRSPGVIVETGAALIAHNKEQIPKKITIYSQENGEAYLHEVPDDDSEIIAATLRLVQQERKRVELAQDILVIGRTNQILDKMCNEFEQNGIPVAKPEWKVPGVRILSAHKVKGLEGKVVIIVNASDHLYGFPCKVENSDVLGPVRMSSSNDESEERRLFYVAVTRAMKRLHIIARHGLPSPYIAEIEGTTLSSTAAKKAIIPPGSRFSNTFFVERVYHRTDRQASANIRQSGLLATKNGRYSFTSWVAFDLQEGSTYRMEGVLTDKPYRDRQQVVLDANTTVRRKDERSPKLQENGTRELNPHRPTAHQQQVHSD